MYIGIDLGTSNSSIAGVTGGKAQIFHPADGGEVLPSVIYIDKRGHRLYGRRAYDQAMIAPENVAAGFKRLMGTATPIEIAGQTLTPEECFAEIIRQLMGQATTETGLETFEGTVISIPAAFNQMQSEATLRAAKLAGLEHVDLIQEPVAAALAAMAGAKRNGKFIVYDLGGGTFDVALVESQQGEIRILAQQGVNMLGGRDFDRLIVHEIVRPWLLANFDLPDNFLRDPQYKRLARIAQLAAEKAKIDLSTLEEASIFASDDEIRLMDLGEAEIFLDAPITRSQFEELIRKPVQHTIDLIARLLEEHEIKAADVDRIVFIGGPTRIPLVRRMVTDDLGIAADLKTDPMTAVAEGAAYYCENRKWDGANAVSQPKPTEGHAEVKEDQDLNFDYAARTPDEKTDVTVRVKTDGAGRRIRLMTEGWDSGTLPLEDGITVTLPLAVVGDNVFDVHVIDASGADLKNYPEMLKIARLVAAPKGVPAAQTIAIKVRASTESQENVFSILIDKGDPLPASGQMKLKTGRGLKAGSSSFIGFEVFQVEYPERVEINLCIGMLRIEGKDLPKGQSIRAGELVDFNWSISEGGLLQVAVALPDSKVEMPSRRFYAPQAGQISYEGAAGEAFAKAVLACAREEWGDLAAAVGPAAGPEVGFLKARLEEQHEILEEALGEAEAVRRVCEDVRFIRQDTARLGRKYRGALAQRQLGKITAAFNRIVRGKADAKENEAFDGLAKKAQGVIDEGDEADYTVAESRLGEMRRLFFTVAWRNPDYIAAWFTHLKEEPWQFADQAELGDLLMQGKKAAEAVDHDALREVVERMLDARISLSASDAVNDLATLIKE